MPTEASHLVTRNKPPRARNKRAANPPFIPETHIPIIDAVELAGKQMYGAEWTGNEYRARVLAPLTGVDVLDEPNLADCGKVVSGDFPTQRSVPSGLWSPPQAPTFVIQPATREDYEVERAAGLRYARAADWLRQRWWSGDLPVCRLDGEMRPFKASRWSDGNFYFWAIRHGVSNVSDEKGHLFVRKSDLQTALGTISRPTRPVPPAAPLMSDRTACQQWLVEQMTAGPPAPGKTKPLYRGEAQKMFGTLSRRGFDSAWDAAITQTGAVSWRAPGKRKSNS